MMTNKHSLGDCLASMPLPSKTMSGFVDSGGDVNSPITHAGVPRPEPAARCFVNVAPEANGDRSRPIHSEALSRTEPATPTIDRIRFFTKAGTARFAHALWHTLLLLVICHGITWCAITNVRISGVTATQVIIRFTAPDLTACSVEVSEESDYTPLVHDVNGTHFSGANLDSREPLLNQGRERQMVIGKRTIDRAGSGVAYSRALQAYTLHYYRVTCGADTATGTFTTASIPFGDTHGDANIPDPDNPGLPMVITPQWERNSTWIDPHTGALIKRVHQPQDNNFGTQFNDNLPASVLESTNWVNPSNVLTVNSTSATYDGASCGATCDWLKLSFSYVIVTSNEQRLDVLRVSINGSGSDATAANRTVEVCPVTLGATTIDAEGVCKDIVLPQTTAAKVTSSVTGIQDTWRVPGKYELTLVQIAPFAAVRFAVRKKNSTGTIAIDAVRFDAWQGTTSNVGTGGMYDRCNVNLRADGTYLCTSSNANYAVNLYSIHAETGFVTFLGSAYRTGSFQMLYDHWLWDSTDPNVMYGQGSGDTDQYRIEYTGAGTEVAAGTKATFTSTALRAGGEVLGTAVQTFVTAHAAEYPGVPLFDPSKFNCPITSVQSDYLIMDCKRGQQDTIAWIAVYRISTQTIIAAQPQFAAPAGRWCVDHSKDPAGEAAVSMTQMTFSKGLSSGNGQYKSTLVGSMANTSSNTTVTVTSTCGGDATCADHVTGEPVSTVGDDYIGAVKVGDVFAIDSEYVRLVTKTSPTSWIVARGVDAQGVSSVPASHADGATFHATCANTPGAGPTDYIASFVTVWDFVGDPYGMDATGTYTWANAYTGHAMIRKNLLVGNKSVAQSAEGTLIASSVKDPAFTKNVPEAPWFAGKSPPGAGNTWQQHVSIHQVNAPVSERQFFWDIRPFVGGNNVMPQTAGCNPDSAIWPTAGGCAAKRVSGLTDVYRIAVTTDGLQANTDGLNPKHLDLMGVAFIRQLRDVSGPGSVLDDSDGKDYTFCYALLANECVPGSSAGQAYVQVPGVTVYYCTGGEGYSGGNDVCLSDYMSSGSALAQHGFAPSKEGLDPAQLSNANATGASWIRVLARHGLTLFHRGQSIFSTGKPLANGKWILAADCVERPGARCLLAIVKNVPPIKDNRNRSTFIPVSVPIPSVPAGTSTVEVEFGYGERGAPTDFRCTTRAERCVAVEAAVNLTTPFYFSSESFTRLSCASGCTVTVPGLPTRLVYLRLKAYNSGGSLIYTGPLEVRSSF